MNARLTSPGIMRKTPCGTWYMEHGHLWLIHALCVILASLLSIGFMTSHSYNLSSCIIALVSWRNFCHLHQFSHIHHIFGRSVFQHQNAKSKVKIWLNACFNYSCSAFFFVCVLAKQPLTVFFWGKSDSLLDWLRTCESTQYIPCIIMGCDKSNAFLNELVRSVSVLINHPKVSNSFYECINKHKVSESVVFLKCKILVWSHKVFKDTIHIIKAEC